MLFQYASHHGNGKMAGRKDHPTCAEPVKPLCRLLSGHSLVCHQCFIQISCRGPTARIPFYLGIADAGYSKITLTRSARRDFDNSNPSDKLFRFHLAFSISE